MLHAEIARSARRAAVLLASSFLPIGVCAIDAQTARPQQPPPARPSASAPADPARIKQDEARLLAILAKDPEHPGALAGMGWVRSRQKNYTAAVSYLERALRQHPHDPHLSVALDEARFHVLLAEAQQSLASDQLDLAQKFYSGALGIHPRSHEALEGLHTVTLRVRLPGARGDSTLAAAPTTAAGQ